MILTDNGHDVGHPQEALEPVMSTLKIYANQDLVDHIQTIVQTGEESALFVGIYILAYSTFQYDELLICLQSTHSRPC